MKNQFGVLFSQILITCFFLCSCGEMVSCKTESTEKKQCVKVVNWNLQTFFDGNFDGNEYTEFKNSKSGWSQQKYSQRLERLAQTIKTLDADILIFEELEKEEQLYDISNRLSGTFNFSKLYQHGYFAKDENSSIGCAVLSRFPLGEAKIHNMDIRSEKIQPSMRPIIQINAYVEGKTLTLFVNHWKSKSSGAEESDFWRCRQEEILSRVMTEALKTNSALLACGDFNKNIDEFFYKETDGIGNIMLLGTRPLSVYSPWINQNGEYVEPGSYYFQNKWERIDHFFAAGKTVLKDFTAETNGEWTNEDKTPFRYTIWNGKGFSDHLPISCTVIF
ncbi:MAG: endonuclease/exonuclease/phosphatase family protein [Treponema sp.]|nr:endonuclease/exonuclease/phosphatase family protein [Candidatus Treponema equifaecale]